MRRLALATAFLFGLGAIASWWPLAWLNLDGDRMLEASRAFLGGGDPYAVAGYLYSPFAPILTAPLTVVPIGLALLLLVKVELVAGYAWLRFGPLLALALVLAPPITSDLVLGNVNLLLVGAAMWAINRDRLLPGAVFGVLFAAFPKPMFLPLLLWLVIFRRRSAVGWLTGLTLSSAVGMLIAGPGLYVEFISLLLRGGDVGAHFLGNAGLSFASPVAGLVVGLAALGVFLWSLRARDPAMSLVAAAVAGVLAGTYQPLYSAELLLGVLPVYAALHPARAPLVLAAAIGSVVSLPIAAVAALAVALVPTPQLVALRDRVSAGLPSRRRVMSTVAVTITDLSRR